MHIIIVILTSCNVSWIVCCSAKCNPRSYIDNHNDFYTLYLITAILLHLARVEREA